MLNVCTWMRRLVLTGMILVTAVSAVRAQADVPGMPAIKGGALEASVELLGSLFHNTFPIQSGARLELGTRVAARLKLTAKGGAVNAGDVSLSVTCNDKSNLKTAKFPSIGNGKSWSLTTDWIPVTHVVTAFKPKPGSVVGTSIFYEYVAHAQDASAMKNVATLVDLIYPKDNLTGIKVPSTSVNVPTGNNLTLHETNISGGSGGANSSGTQSTNTGHTQIGAGNFLGGPTPPSKTMPNVVGRSFADAGNALVGLGIPKNKIVFVKSLRKDAQTGVVVRQSPSPGTPVTASSQVLLGGTP